MKIYSIFSTDNEENDIELTPSYQGKDCIGNGTSEGIECQCDECNFFLECFEEFKKR